MKIKHPEAQRLRDKVAIVTGGGGNPGIGRSIALRFAAEGAKVAIFDIDEAGAKAAAEEIMLDGGVAQGFCCDVLDEEQIKAATKATADSWGGRIDVLVNNAAVYKGMGGFRPFDEWSSAEWDRTMAVNVKGCWNCAKAVVPYMKAQQYGKIINLSSSSFFLGVPGFIHYISSKGAVVGFTRGLAKELGVFGIRVNALAPGYTMTEESIIADQKKPGYAEWQKNQQALGQRNQLPEDLAGPALFLATEDSDFVTGSTILVDGGVGVW